MAIKVEITTYKNNAAATFWARLQTLLTYFSPLVIFAVLFMGLPVTGGHGIGMILWGIGSVAVGIIFCVVSNILCMKMINKALKKQSNKSGDV